MVASKLSESTKERFPSKLLKDITLKQAELGRSPIHLHHQIDVRPTHQAQRKLPKQLWAEFLTLKLRGKPGHLIFAAPKISKVYILYLYILRNISLIPMLNMRLLWQQEQQLQSWLMLASRHVCYSFLSRTVPIWCFDATVGCIRFVDSSKGDINTDENTG